MTTVSGVPGAAGVPVRPAAVQTEVGAASATAAISVADPAPLGLGAFGLTTLCLSVVNAGFIPKGATVLVLAMAIPFGGAAQFLAGMWAFRRGNTFAATAFSSFGAFWISFYLLVSVFAPQVKDPNVTSQFIGLYLLAWGIFTAYMTIASLGAARAVQLVFVLLTATFVVLAFGEWGNSSTVTNVGGYIGLATAAAALYASFADVTNATLRRTILPT